jgi:hypothetical protein
MVSLAAHRNDFQSPASTRKDSPLDSNLVSVVESATDCLHQMAPDFLQEKRIDWCAMPVC